ncbi:hypothetical protein KCP75_04980 [Salmonella enterica subsp. enterica]|nr:hypothetical protein KCP75_04980 [Salmonella enterica subsp. enterica]
MEQNMAEEKRGNRRFHCMSPTVTSWRADVPHGVCSPERRRWGHGSECHWPVQTGTRTFRRRRSASAFRMMAHSCLHPLVSLLWLNRAKSHGGLRPCAQLRQGRDEIPDRASDTPGLSEPWRDAVLR